MLHFLSRIVEKKHFYDYSPLCSVESVQLLHEIIVFYTDNSYFWLTNQQEIQFLYEWCVYLKFECCKTNARRFIRYTFQTVLWYGDSLVYYFMDILVWCCEKCTCNRFTKLQSYTTHYTNSKNIDFYDIFWDISTGKRFFIDLNVLRTLEWHEENTVTLASKVYIS